MSLRLFGQVIALLVVVSTGLLADGITLKKGRYADGPVIELRLSKGQAELVRKHYKQGMMIVLTPEQREEIRVKAKLKEAPTKLSVIKGEKLVGDCTCFASNIGLPYKPGWLEIPIGWAMSDHDAELNRVADDE